MLVCRDLPDISNNSETVPAGPTQIVQRKRAAENVQNEKAIEKHNRKMDESTATNLKLKEATIVGMKGAAIKQRIVTMATSVEMTEKQINLLSFKGKHRNNVP